MSDPRPVIDHLLDRINARDAEGVAELLADEHRFIDAMGREIIGREAMFEAWRGYFAVFPGYAIDAEMILADGDRVAIFGVASGSNDHASWSTRAAWYARVDGEHVGEWRVYCDVQAQLRALGAPIDGAPASADDSADAE